MRKRLIKIRRDNGKVFFHVQRRTRFLLFFKIWTSVEYFVESKKKEAVEFYESYCPENTEITTVIRQT